MTELSLHAHAVTTTTEVYVRYDVAEKSFLLFHFHLIL